MFVKYNLIYKSKYQIFIIGGKFNTNFVNICKKGLKQELLKKIKIFLK